MGVLPSSEHSRANCIQLFQPLLPIRVTRRKPHAYLLSERLAFMVTNAELVEAFAFPRHQQR